MDGAGILIVGVLVVAAVLAITSAIIAVAPFVAGGLVIVGLCWFVFKKDPPPPIPPVAKPKANLRE